MYLTSDKCINTAATNKYTPPRYIYIQTVKMVVEVENVVAAGTITHRSPLRVISIFDHFHVYSKFDKVAFISSSASATRRNIYLLLVKQHIVNCDMMCNRRTDYYYRYRYYYCYHYRMGIGPLLYSW